MFAPCTISLLLSCDIVVWLDGNGWNENHWRFSIVMCMKTKQVRQLCRFWWYMLEEAVFFWNNLEVCGFVSTQNALIPLVSTVCVSKQRQLSWKWVSPCKVKYTSRQIQVPMKKRTVVHSTYLCSIYKDQRFLNDVQRTVECVESERMQNRLNSARKTLDECWKGVWFVHGVIVNVKDWAE